MSFRRSESKKWPQLPKSDVFGNVGRGPMAAERNIQRAQKKKISHAAIQFRELIDELDSVMNRGPTETNRNGFQLGAMLPSQGDFLFCLAFLGFPKNIVSFLMTPRARSWSDRMCGAS